MKQAAIPRQVRTFKRRSAEKTNPLAYLFLLPAFGMMAFFMIWPALQTFYISTTSWDGISPKKFVGLQNYIHLFTDEPMFLQAIKNTLLWVVGGATIPVCLGLVFANLLVRGKIRFTKWFQMGFFFPQIISSVIAAVIWKWIYDPSFGPLSAILDQIGIGRPVAGWLGNPDLVMYALFVVFVWGSFGYTTMLFTAALQSVDSQLYDAANIDGCGPWKQFRHVTIPGLKQTITTVVILMTIGSFSVFDIVMATTKGGPGYSSYVISYYVYTQGFIFNRLGFAAAASIVLTLFILIVSRTIIWIRERDQ
ncbi:carbohydrate ABC transporter permease [Cohnella cholangitidis]|uniref:Sugar ABC transporter permease n=1 Tax=Cohnella cholangitidis TaxID=2598458 RepID=A0A7G5C497_9BACL|nr:sugar ABC transporter permease [Cohnella cholangitidis]QMV44031.1 sugar ABC transporter permease [Cohnella cholangitidis]